MDPPLSLVIHIIVTLQKKKENNNNNNKKPAFVSLGEDHRCISTFWLLWTVNSIFISSCFWQNLLLSTFFFFFASGCLFIERKEKSSRGTVFMCLAVCLSYISSWPSWSECEVCIRDSIKVYSLQQEMHQYIVAKIGCKMKTCWRHMIATEQKLISHWKALLKNLRYHYFFKHCYYIIWR